jgi:hypothetical protein
MQSFSASIGRVGELNLLDRLEGLVFVLMFGVVACTWVGHTKLATIASPHPHTSSGVQRAACNDWHADHVFSTPVD